MIVLVSTKPDDEATAVELARSGFSDASLEGVIVADGREDPNEVEAGACDCSDCGPSCRRRA
jgi:hypothetical protein